MAISKAMMAMTTSNSIKVKAFLVFTRQFPLVTYQAIQSIVSKASATLFEKRATSQPRIEIRKIAASFLLAMTAIFMLSPFFTAMGNKNRRHREERSDLHLFISLKNTDKLPWSTGCTHTKNELNAYIGRCLWIDSIRQRPDLLLLSRLFNQRCH